MALGFQVMPEDKMIIRVILDDLHHAIDPGRDAVPFFLCRLFQPRRRVSK